MQVLGASADKPDTNRRFAEKHGLRMPLLSDEGGHEVTTAFGVARPMVGAPKRTTFLMDSDGTLRKVYAKVSAKGHAAEVLSAARELWGQGAGAES